MIALELEYFRKGGGLFVCPVGVDLLYYPFASHGLAVELTAAGRWFIWMNYFVHSIMYTYYTMVSTGLRPPKRFSMAVTALQTTQMLVGVTISVYVLYLKLSGTPNKLFMAVPEPTGAYLWVRRSYYTEMDVRVRPARRMHWEVPMPEKDDSMD
uniref:Elongation of very long chain fatty acids protein n=1 Tax=Angiostrongylus cantonensis TaxID=6313 RepID=A0A0K0CVW8_ANGCA